MAAKKKAVKKAVKKSAKKAVKKVAKKSVAKRTVKKTTKKAVKRTAASAASTFKVPAVPTRATTTKRISSEPVQTKAVGITPAKSAPAKDKTASRTFITILAGVVLIALLVVSRNGSDSNKSDTEAKATPEASSSQSAMEQKSPAASPEAESTGHGAPQGIVAHYNSKGATIYWNAPAETEGISNYQIEIASNGGEFKVASTVPASQLSLDIAASDTTGWCSFRVSTVYSDGKVIAGKVFGLPGQWS